MDNYDTDLQEEEVVETEVEEQEQVETEVEEDEEEIDYKAKWEESEQARKKAEQTIIKAKSKPHKEVKQSSDVKLSTFDLLALQRANIETEEDLDEITRWAGYNSITIAEALKSNILKATLAEKAEKRTSALVVNTGGGRRAGGQISDERLIEDARKGIMPDSDSDLSRLTRLTIARK